MCVHLITICSSSTSVSRWSLSSRHDSLFNLFSQALFCMNIGCFCKIKNPQLKGLKNCNTLAHECAFECVRVLV